LEALNQDAVQHLQEWVDSSAAITVNYPDQVEALISRILEVHAPTMTL
jgi:hypothetical protein